MTARHRVPQPIVGAGLPGKLRRRAEQAVSDPDVMVEERQRLARLECLKPQTHPAKFGRHRVHVDPVKASANHVTQCMLVKQR